jgi:hypothetical protein
MVMEVIYRLLGAIIVIGGMIAVSPLLISGSTAPICNVGSYVNATRMCEYTIPVNATCPAGWTQYGQFCDKAPKYNDATTQLIVLFTIAIVFIAGIVYIFREKQYS